MGSACEPDSGEDRAMARPRRLEREFVRAGVPARGRHHDRTLVLKCDPGVRLYIPNATAFRRQKDLIALRPVLLRLLREEVGELVTDGLIPRMTTTDSR